MAALAGHKAFLYAGQATEVMGVWQITKVMELLEVLEATVSMDLEEAMEVLGEIMEALEALEEMLSFERFPCISAWEVITYDPSGQ
jgi:hypothetical protein